MYKSKLQQLCQQKLWPLPNYSCVKDGLDHCPSFKAFVLVNGVSFDSAPACKSSKEAQNDAAMRAFVRLGFEMETMEDEPVRPELKNGVEDQSSKVLGNTLISRDVQYPYKLQLQTYAQRNHLSLPSYSVTSMGPPHDCHFVACVTVGEQDFRSSAASKTVKEAENAAARAALTVLSPDGFEQICPSFVKNLLQELAQKEGLSVPKYKTCVSGPLHMQMFYSTVEVGGEIFQGKAARSKKLSEINAAEFAYRSLEERRLNRTSLSKQLASPETKDLETKNHSYLKDALHGTTVNKSCLHGSDSAKIKDQLTKYEVAEPTPIKKSQTDGQLTSEESIPPPKMQSNVCKNLLTGKATQINKADNKDQLVSQKGISPPTFQIDYSKKAEESESKPTVCALSEDILTPAEPLVTPAALQDSLAALSVVDSGPSNSTAYQSYLLCNRVRVYSCIPDIKFPKGITLIPIGVNKWVPVSLEFPNEKDM
ncbi:hypothetical protein QQ045_002965 [Rhodiola kirilowii]